MALPPSRTADKIMIRLPDGMRERLTESATSRGRSVNADVISRIEASFKMEEDAYEGIRTVEELRQSTNARMDEMEREHREQRALFEQMVAAIRSRFGPEVVTQTFGHAVDKRTQAED